MSPRDLNEMEQLDALAAELTEAGHIARLATIHRERPEPEFSMRLRADLMRALPSHKSAAAVAPIVAPSIVAPMPPARPLDPAERRHGVLPFVVPNRRAVDAQSADIDVISGAEMEEAEKMRAGKRWAATRSNEPKRSHDLLGLPLIDQAAHDAEDAGRITALKPSMRWHIPSRVMPSRWIAVGLAASVAAVSLFYGGGLFFNTHGVDTASDANAATLVRGGTSSALVVGAELRQGDEIKVAVTGRATLQLGRSYVRMAGGSDVALVSLDPDHTVVSQVTGRVYHRVNVVGGGDYSVQTAQVTWKADTTAFDLTREFTGGGGERVLGMALYDNIAINGPHLAATLDEGSSATVVLTPDGSAAGAPAIVPTTQQALLDDWLISNAGIDNRMGLPLGRLASVLSPEPTVSPTAKPTQAPTAKPTQAPAQVPTEAPAPTRATTPMPTPMPTPKPTSTPWGYLGALTIVHNGNGSYTFSWPKYQGSGFAYYKVMHADYPAIPNYGHVGDYWACPNDVKDTSWTGFIGVGNYNVRLQVIDAGSNVKAQTQVVHLNVTTSPATVDLGGLTFVDKGGGNYKFSWTAYTGGLADDYKLVYEPVSSGKQPSIPGSGIWAAPAIGATSTTVSSIPAGDYLVRIQAIGDPGGSTYVFAQTTVLELHVP